MERDGNRNAPPVCGALDHAAAAGPEAMDVYEVRAGECRFFQLLHAPVSRCELLGLLGSENVYAGAGTECLLGRGEIARALEDARVEAGADRDDVHDADHESITEGTRSGSRVPDHRRLSYRSRRWRSVSNRCRRYANRPTSCLTERPANAG